MLCIPSEPLSIPDKVRPQDMVKSRKLLILFLDFPNVPIHVLED